MTRVPVNWSALHGTPRSMDFPVLGGVPQRWTLGLCPFAWSDDPARRAWERHIGAPWSRLGEVARIFNRSLVGTMV